MLLPTLEVARERARIAKCQSNQRQVGAYLAIYANDYGTWPTNEWPTENFWYYRYRARGGNGTRYISQIAGDDGYYNPVFRCTASLPGSNGMSGSIPSDGQNWCWGARTSGGGEWNQNRVVNNNRSWFYYQGPLRKYPEWCDFWDCACTDWDTWANAWDRWGDAWRGNSSLAPYEPFNSPGNSPTYYKKYTTPYGTHKPAIRVIAYCPEAEQVPGGSLWWHNWVAPHLRQPWSGDVVTLTPAREARNYLFTDGHVIFYSR